MKLTFIILCVTTVFFGVKCGLIKNLLGTVSDKVHQVTDGNIIQNMGNMLYNETKGIVEDFGDLLHLRKNKTNEKKEGTENSKNVQHGEVSNSPTSATIQASTATTTTQIVQPNEPDIQDMNTKPSTETNAGKVKEGDGSYDNQEESRAVSRDPSESSKLVFIEDDHHYGEGKISPRIARHIQTHSETEGDLVQQEKLNTNTFDEVIVMYENSKLTNFNNLSDDKITDMSYENSGIEVVIIKDCPEGQEMILDGSCIETDFSTEKNNQQGVGRASFVAGCFNGFAKADDGSCQEVLYD